MPLSKRILPHGKKSILKNVSGSNVSSLALSDNILQLNQTNNVPQRTVTLPVVGISAGTNVTVSESSGVYTINSAGGGGGGGSGIVASSSQGQLPFYKTAGVASTISGTSVITFNSTNESLNVLTSVAGDAGLMLRNTNAASTANGLAVFDESDSRRLDVGYNNNTNESYIWSYAADVPLKIATNGTERMRILAGGNVGINTNNPSALLHVISGSNGYAARFDDGILLDGNNVQLLGYGQGNLWVMGNSGNPKLTLGYSHNWNYAVSLEYLKNATPNVGLSEFKVGQTQKNATTYDHGITSFYTSGSETMRLTANNRVGIGTDSPVKTLDVSGAIHTTQDYYLRRTGGAFYYQNTAGTNLWALYETNGDLAVYDYQGGGAQMVTFKNGGNVGIGSTNPSYPLHVMQGSNTYGMYMFNNGSKGIYFGDTNNDGTGFGKIGGVGGSLFLGSTQVYTSFIPTSDSSANLGQSNRRWSYSFFRYGQFGYSSGDDENSGSGGYVLGVSGNADRHPFMVKAYGDEGVPSFIVTSGSNVGIGTASPGYSLVVSGSAPEIQIKGNTPRLRLEDIDSGRSDWNLGLDSTQNGLNFAEVGVADNVLFLEAGGDVGIGTSGPTAKLDVRGSAKIGSSSYTTISDNEYDVSSGDFLLDVADDITLDAAGGDVKFSKAGGNKFTVYMDTNDNVWLQAKGTDKDLNITGVDNDTGQVTALSFDMSEAGLATFNTTPVVGTMTSSDNSTKAASTAYVTTAVAAAGGGDVSKSGTPVDNQLAIWTGANTIEGNANFTYNGTIVDINGNLRVQDSHTLAAGDSDDFYLYHDGNSTLRNDTGIFNITQNATSNLVMTTNGNSNQLVLKQSNGGVGVGTDAPSEKLHVVGNITGSSNLNLGTGVELQGGGTSTFSNAVNIGATDANQNTYLKIMGSGAGYTAAGIKLLTYNGANRPGGVYSYNHPNTAGWYSGPLYGTSFKWGVAYKSSLSDTGSSLESTADDANAIFTIQPDGKVGIGTTTPQQPLHVLTSANDKGILIDVSDDTHEGRLLFGDTSSNAIGHIGYNHALETMRFTVGGYETVRMANDGSYSKLFLGADSTLGLYRYSNRMDFYISSNPRMHLDASKLYSATSGGPLLDLTPTGGEANYGFYGDQNTGMSRSAADTLHLLTAGVSGMTMNSTQGVGIGVIAPDTLRQGQGLTISGTGITSTAYTSSTHTRVTSLYAPSLGSGSYVLAGIGGKHSQMGGGRAEPPYMVIGAAEQTSLHQNAMGGGRAVSLVLAGTAGYNSGGQDYGNFGSLLFHGNSNWSSNARRWLVSNAWRRSGAGDMGLGFASETSASLDPTISGSIPSVVFSTDSNYGTAGKGGLLVGNTSHIATGKVTVVDADNGVPLTLAWDGSHYTTFGMNSGGDTVIKSHHGQLALETDTGGERIRLDSKGDVQADLGGAAGTYLFKVVDSSQNWLFTVHDDGLVGLHGSDPAIEIKERASAPNHTAAFGKLWVKNDDPANLYYTDDDGNDIALTNNGSAAGGGGSAAGSDTQVQFNDGGSSFGGDAGLTYVKGTDTLTVASNININANLISGSSGHLQLYAADNVNLNSEAGITNFNYRGTETFRIAAGASSPVTLQPKASGYDLVLAAQDGTSVLHLDSADKHIGIGTTNPSYKLDVYDDVSSFVGRFKNTSNNGYVLRLEASDSTLDFQTDHIIYSYNMHFGDDSKNLYLRTLGRKLGVGTSSPATAFHVSGTNIVSRFQDTTGVAFTDIKRIGVEDTYAAVLAGNAGQALGTTDDAYTDIWTNKSRYIAFRHATGSTTDGATTYMSGSRASSEYLRFKTTGNNYSKGAVIEGPNELYIRTAGKDLSLDSGNNLTTHYDKEYAIYNDTGNPVFHIRSGSTAAIEYEADGDIRFKSAGTSTKMSMLTNGNFGIGTTAPDDLLHVLGGDVDPSIKLQNNRSGHNGYYLMEHRGSTLKLQSTGSAVVPIRFTIQNADIMRIDDTGLGIGTDAPSSSLHVSGGAIQKDIGESVYLRAIHAGFDSNAILQHQPNTQYVKAEATSPPGAGAIPTELPLAESKYTGLEITVMQRWDADPEGALTVQKQAGSSDVIYEGGSNSASATVSIAAYRGANKTFVIVAPGVWVVKD